MKIKDNFEKEYNLMMDLGIKRFKNHQVLINKEVQLYTKLLKEKLSDYNSDNNNSSLNSDCEVSRLNESIDSAELDKDFDLAMKNEGK